MADGGVVHRVPDSEWTPASTVLTVSNVLRFALTWCGSFMLLMGCLTMTREWRGLLLGAALCLLPVALHEIGHAGVAILGGATIMRVQVGPVEVQPLRDGWRARWKRGPRGIAGLVQTFPSMRTPLRRQMIAVIAAGPLVNALLAAGALGLGYAIRDEPVGFALLGFGAFNATIVLSNLLPWCSASSLVSDGLQLLRWLRGIGDDDPQVALMSLTARLISGERFGAWADDYLRVLEKGSQPGPMFVLWIRLKSLQRQGEWSRVDEVMRQVELHIIGLSPPMAKAMEGFIAILRCEAAFSRAMAGQTLERSPVDELGPDMGWLLPAVRLRCEALDRVLDGRLDEAHARLVEAAAWAKRSVDRSLEHDEAVVRVAGGARTVAARLCGGAGREAGGGA